MKSRRAVSVFRLNLRLEKADPKRGMLVESKRPHDKACEGIESLRSLLLRKPYNECKAFGNSP